MTVSKIGEMARAGEGCSNFYVLYHLSNEDYLMEFLPKLNLYFSKNGYDESCYLSDAV